MTQWPRSRGSALRLVGRGFDPRLGQSKDFVSLPGTLEVALGVSEHPMIPWCGTAVAHHSRSSDAPTWDVSLLVQLCH